MDQEEPEMGRFKPKGNGHEPNEPFLPEEQVVPGHEPKPPLVGRLLVPKEPLSKERLKTFLLELIPFIQQEQQLSQKEEALLAHKLKTVEESLQQSKFSEEIKNTFSQIVQKCVHTMSLHLEPKARKELINQLEALLFKL